LPRQPPLYSSTAPNSQRYKMIDSQRPSQRRPMRSLPADRGQLKTSTYIVPCFLFVEMNMNNCQLQKQHHMASSVFSSLTPKRSD
ncbi:hypothetical protein CHARACLAT_003616, partial [Characodon lateralis]|nr:hypothetical protein [Characodon lateralis]